MTDSKNCPPVEDMTMRDYFAIEAMHGMLAGNVTFVDVGYDPQVKATIMDHQAICAYQMADAMLKARAGQ